MQPCLSPPARITTNWVCVQSTVKRQIGNSPSKPGFLYYEPDMLTLVITEATFSYWTMKLLFCFALRTLPALWKHMFLALPCAMGSHHIRFHSEGATIKQEECRESCLNTLGTCSHAPHSKKLRLSVIRISMICISGKDSSLGLIFANISSGTHGSGTGVTSNRPERTSQEMKLT
ncbi:hypothetical protein NC652_002688 [Populus alba x Populus x berolinensis]|nr:hypothetical protein NC652_002688 [Populus alba x Populus x berolinensis]